MGNRNLEVTLGKLRLRTPLMTASGTSGSSNEARRLRMKKALLESLGAFVTKGVTLEERKGNPEPRVVESRTGLLNSIGLQNKGVKRFLLEDLPDLLAYELPIIVNISAGTIEEFGVLASFIRDHDINKKISGIEINVSCPNIKEGGIAFGTNPRSVEKVVKMVKRNTCKDVLIVTKLSPNVTDITLPAKAAIAGGTDVLSMINTLRGVAIDIDERRPFLGNAVGGVSGPAIKPIGVFMVYQCYNKIPECRRREVPIIGIGGISIWQDAIEYIMAGATAVGIGTAWFVYPEVFHEIKKSLEDFLDSQDTSISDLVGVANV